MTIKSLFNQDKLINIYTSELTYQELQVKIEQDCKEQAINKFTAAIEAAKKDERYDNVPSFNNLNNKVFEEAKALWEETRATAMAAKTKKSSLWANLLAPMNAAYNTHVANHPNLEKHITKPHDLVPYLITREMMIEVYSNDVAKISLKVLDILDTLQRTYCIEADFDQVEEMTPAHELGEKLTKGVFEFIKTLISTSEFLVIADATDLDDPEAARGGYVVFSDKVKETIIRDFDDELSKKMNAYEPMLVEPENHKNLHDADGGYLITESKLNKHYYGFNTAATQFNDETNPDFFNTINFLQKTAYSVNTNFFGFLDGLYQEGNETVINHLVPNLEEEQKALKTIKAEINPVLKPLLKKKTTGWDTYWKLREKNDKLKETNINGCNDKKIAELDEKITENQSKLSVISDEVEEMMKPLKEANSRISKARANRRTLDLASKYAMCPDLYLPLNIGANGRVYYYCSDLQPQGNNLQKALLSLSHTQAYSLNDGDAMNQFKFALGTMIDGMDKKTEELRIQAVNDNHQVIMDFVERKSDEFLNIIDQDEIFTAIALAVEYYLHHTEENYKTTIIGYVDACSSAVQIQGLTQKCNQCLTLTNVINPEGDTLEDAYAVAGQEISNAAEQISAMTDEELNELVNSYF